MTVISFSPSIRNFSTSTYANNLSNLSFGHKVQPSKDSVEIKAPAKKIHEFGTSGFRKIGDEFTDALPQILTSMSDYLIEEFNKSGTKTPKPVIIGIDTRALSLEGQWLAAMHFLKKGFDVYLRGNNVVTPTPVLAYYAKNWHEFGKEKEAAGAILFTASHNPWEYGGINFLTPDGEVAPTSMTKQFEALQASPKNLSIDRKKLKLPPAIIENVPSSALYTKHLRKLINFEEIKKAKIEIAYDSMYGAAVGDFINILRSADIRRVTNLRQNIAQPWKGFKELPNGPDPTDKNLYELKNAVANIKHPDNLKVGLANDGDADRFGIIDEKGNFIQPNDVIALVLYHLIKNKKRDGIVVRSQATSHMLDEIAEKYSSPVVQTPVGYKYIAEVFKESEHAKSKVVIGGESSGGLSIYGHIPEKDGIIANLSILELMAYEKKNIGEILSRLKGSLQNTYLFTEMGIKTDKKDEIANYFQSLFDKGGQFAGLEIDVQKSHAEAAKLKDKFHTQDGCKLYFKDGSWLLVRKSGTEPMARIYFEAIDKNASVTGEKPKKLAPEDEKTKKYCAAEEKSLRLDKAIRQLLTQQFKVPVKQIETKLSGTGPQSSGHTQNSL